MSRDVARVASRQLTLLQAKLESIDTAIHDLDDTEEDIACILEGYRDQVAEVKAELTALESSLLNVCPCGISIRAHRKCCDVISQPNERERVSK